MLLLSLIAAYVQQNEFESAERGGELNYKESNFLTILKYDVIRH